MNGPHKPLLGRILRSIVSLHGSPEAIALGAAIGVFIAFTPTVGFQMLLGALLATLVKANRPAAMIPSVLTNPVTIPPVFALCYRLGSFLWPGPSVGEVYDRLTAAVRNLTQVGWHELHLQFLEFVRIGADIYGTMFLGGVIIGLVAAAIAYPATLWTVRHYRVLLGKIHLHQPESGAGRPPGGGR
jgi:hypothetical protein